MAGKYDEMSFSKAFAAARKEMGKGGTFTWKGKSYTTNYKEETAAKAPAKTAAPAESKAPVARPKAGSTKGTGAMQNASSKQAAADKERAAKIKKYGTTAPKFSKGGMVKGKK